MSYTVEYETGTYTTSSPTHMGHQGYWAGDFPSIATTTTTGRQA